MTTASPTSGFIPSSDALSEASSLGDSLSEAVSRFDAAIVGGTQDSAEARAALRRIIEANRQQRERLRLAEAAGTAAPQRSAKQPLGSRLVGAKLTDIGL